MRKQLISLIIFSLICTTVSMPTVPVYATEVVSDTEQEIADDSEVKEETEADQEQEEIDLEAERKNYKINKSSASVKKGKKITLKVSGARGDVKWSSSNKKIATVSQKGVVTGKKSGKVTIKVYCAALDKTLQCKVEVYEKQSQAQITKKILNLKSKYPEGMSWTNERNHYYWSAINCYCSGCIAFAGEVSDKIFGKDAKVKQHKSFSKIKAGDHVRIGGYHSVIVISKSGDTITVVEGNYNSSVHWGRKITKSELERSGFYVDTRY